MKKTDIIKYIVAFVITSAVFFTAFLISNYFNDRRIEDIRTIEDKISVDILSSETQFSLLRDSSCAQLSDTILSQELNSLASRLDYAEKELGVNNEEVLRLKRFYSLLQIKDYLLMQQLSTRCDIKPVSILYFYTNKEDCPDCQKQAYVLDYLRTQYPRLRVYAFDYDLNLSAIDTLIKLNKVERKFPALVTSKGVLYGFNPVEAIESHVPGIQDLIAATSTAATTTKATSTKGQ